MKKLLSFILALVLAVGMPVGAFAANNIGSSDFDWVLGSDGKVISRTVKSTNTTYRVTGVYHEDESKRELSYVNQARREEGLPALKWDDKLVEPAIQRAMEQFVRFDHVRPDDSHWRTVDSYAHGENLAKARGTYFDAAVVTDGWLNSPSHRANILGETPISARYTSMAAVCVETEEWIVWVQLFHVAGENESDSSDSTKTAETTTDETKGTSELTAQSITADLGKAKANGNTVSLTLQKAVQLPADVLKAASDWAAKNKKTVSLTVNTPTASGKSTQGKLTLNPAKFTKNKNAIKTGVYIEAASVKSAKDNIAKAYPKASFAVISLEQSGSYGGSVTVSAKINSKDNLGKLDTKSLLFYTYDAKTGKLTKLDLGKAGYSVDKNNYLRFQVSKGGYIVVSDKEIK